MGAYRALLHLFPASFRREYGAEMCALFARRRRDAAGLFPKAALWADAVQDVLHNAFRVHADLLQQDLRYTARTLRRAPGFAVTAVLVAAFGVGATTATFSITDHVLVRPLPFPRSERLLKLWGDDYGQGYSRTELSPANYRDWKAMSASFQGMAAFTMVSVNLVGEGEPPLLLAKSCGYRAYFTDPGPTPLRGSEAPALFAERLAG